MRAQERVMARRNIDKRMSSLQKLEFARPPRGWVKAIRESLGMSAAQLAARIGVTPPRVYELEKAEVSGSITLKSLERAARAMDCRVVYTLIPVKPLEDIVEERATKVAAARLRSASHSMGLENQRVGEDDEQHQLEALVKKLIKKSGSGLWESE